jgi:outer membrane receptor protein involved in Fe transport
VRAFKQLLFSAILLISACVQAAVFGSLRGIVHDPSHRPVPGARVTLRAAHSEYTQWAETGGEGEFAFQAVPAGEYVVSVAQPGFESAKLPVTVSASAAPLVHLQLKLAEQSQSTVVSEQADAVNAAPATPSMLVSRAEIQQTPGADLTNSLTMITSFVPGAYMTHDQLHIRGGHQVTWAVDGVPIPNTNIASNVGPQMDPKDIDYLEVSRGGYAADLGDRTYGVFNVVPRTGFERDREMDIVTTYGSFHQTNNQLSYGGHSQTLGWLASVNGNRSDYGLETPGPDVVHDRVWGLGGFGSLIYNSGSNDQLRLTASLRRDDYQVPNTDGLSDVERERDAVATLNWSHRLSSRLLLAVSPFVHYNRANYDGDPTADPVSAVQHLASLYGGGQAELGYTDRTLNASLGLYGFAQHDDEFIHLTDTGSGSQVQQSQPGSGGLVALFSGGQWRPYEWVTLTAGLRYTHFSGAVVENATDPRVALAIRVPKLRWTLRGYYGRYYQAPPLSTVSGPLLEYAVAQGLGVIPLNGERDQEYQAGLLIPLRGWSFDLNSFHMRAANYFDHNAVGNSNVFFPLSIAGARISGWEVTLHSPRIRRRAEVSLAYSRQIAEGQGAVTGGLTDFAPPDNGYFLLDHDQRHTLHVNLNVTLAAHTWMSAGVYYGSGFTDGSSDTPAHLPGHTTVDFSVGHDFGERLTLSATALNAANRRFLLDNSETFGGTHYAEPRQVYVQLRYRFRL